MSSTDIPKAYDPKLVEDKWYQDWLKNGHFTADPKSAKLPYCIVIPPPNVTGVLTMGHVLNNSLQDILCRRKRMQGFEVLWLPGTDHAGIATQTVVERTLRKQGAIRHRNDLGREKLVAKIWEWKEKHGGIIIQQLKKLGCSCDWSRERFTMDDAYSKAVLHCFVDLYKKGLIYRGKRMVNWCPVSQTTLSDEEVTMKEVQGELWHFKYPLVTERGEPSKTEFLVVATTRPETMLGDEAVAVHPNDERYKKLVGRKVLLPIQNKQIPIIADPLVDPKFGTGCVKVTPAHDPADYEMAQRHNLPLTVVIGPDGRMTEVAGEDFEEMDRLECREAVVEKLRLDGLLLKTEPYMHNVGYSERADVPIEPRVSEQWFLKYPQVEKSLAAVEKGDIKFYPERWSKTYTHWLGNIRDWAISRQLWWGHRIPVWHKRVKLTVDNWHHELLHWGWDDYVSGHWAKAGVKIVVRIFRAGNGEEVNPKQDSLMPIVPSTEGDYDIFVCVDDEQQGAAFEQDGFQRDPDVLDTWASSWLWPFATMGRWPEEQSATLKKFYPTTDLVTGPDIIFFWVARMIMAGYEFMGEKPFSNVYFTGIIRDALGRKMSKSLGNSPDPLDLIAKYGADGLRFGLMLIAPQGSDILFAEERMEVGRNFCNKLWNSARLRQMQNVASSAVKRELLLSDDHHILAKLDDCIREVSGALDRFEFNQAAQSLYGFFWGEYCDWYLEVSKSALQGTDAALKANVCAVMDTVLSNVLRLLHPFAPFITEELWHGLGFAQGQTIQFAEWPKPTGLGDASVVDWVTRKHALVVAGRNLRAEKKIAPGKKANFKVQAKTPDIAARLQQELPTLRILLNAEQIEFVGADFQSPSGTPAAVAELGSIFMPLEGLVDPAAERKRIEAQLVKLAKEIEGIDRKLANQDFVAKAPPAVVAQQRAKREELQRQQAELQKLLS
ncbi:MAG: valine--tRNA ligase [Verrucomicrobia bacterium]|nr:valine--tRNA ligase [Verrucomicrobiota bacterium]